MLRQLRKILLLIVILCVIIVSNAQDNKMSLGIGGGGAYTSAKDNDAVKDSGFGVNIYLNGMYNVSANISAGIEYNYRIVVIFPGAGIDLDKKITNITSILAQVKYAFGDGNTKPFVGIMAGLYIINRKSIAVELGFDRKSVFGFAPEVGIQAGSLQFAVSYHLPGKYKSHNFDLSLIPIPVETRYTIVQFNIRKDIGLMDN